jgi:hypothetical protein
MWDKRKGQPNTCKEFDKFWLGPYKIEKKSINDSYYISTLEGRRLPLPISRIPSQTPSWGGDLTS